MIGYRDSDSAANKLQEPLALARFEELSSQYVNDIL